MKKMRYIGMAMVLVIMAGCDDAFLDTTNKFGSNTDTFYKTRRDYDAALGGVYNSLYISGGNVFAEEHITASLLDDTMLGGGGPDDQGAKNVDAFIDPTDDTYQDLWIETYKGVFRANTIIEKIVDTDLSADFSDADEEQAYKNRVAGEMYFMRGFLMFRAAKFFGGMPLITSTSTPRDIARATFAETFGQIASDFKMAIEMMPAIDPSEVPLSEYGHANHWVAQGYLARVYLFYTGYMANIENAPTDVFNLPDGSTIGKDYVVDQLTDCVDNSGYQLVSDFRNLWPYSYVNQSAGSVKYQYAADNNLQWVGQDGFNSTVGTGNTEVMFALRYTFADWGWTLGQRTTNRSALFMALRGNSGLTPFGEGWGWGTIHPDFVSSWDNADPRKWGSILRTGVAEEGTAGYAGDKGDHETGFFNKKYIHLEYAAPEMKGLFNYVYNWPNTDMQLRHAQDFYYMRFADVLLMLSELTEDEQYMNQVRDRAGLAPLAGYTLEDLKTERLHELSFEGLRWFDLVRWGDVDDDSKNFYDNLVQVKNSGAVANYQVNYRPETKGLVSIPESEIRLSNGVYQQNPGW